MKPMMTSRASLLVRTSTFLGILRLVSLRQVLLVFLAFLKGDDTSGQDHEHLDNGGFESGDEPHKWAQFGRCHDWESENYFNGSFSVHSPDYFSVPFNVNIGEAEGDAQGIPPHGDPASDGVRYVGLGTYELIQQEYGELDIGDWYSVSMDVRLHFDNWSTWNNTSELRVMLARQRIRYQNDEYCGEGYVDYAPGIFGSQDIKVIGSRVLSADDFNPVDGWVRLAFSFYASNDIVGMPWIADGYNWLAIECRQLDATPTNDPQWCFTDYVFVDNVSLRSADYCNSPCGPDLGPIEWGVLVNGQIDPGNTEEDCFVNSEDAFALCVKNALGIDFAVYSENQVNNILYQQQDYNVNGLIDVPYNGYVFEDYVFYWWGELLDGSQLDQGGYVYDMRIWNCNETIELDHVFLAYFPSNFPDPIGPPHQQNFELEDCCDEFAYYQNQTLSGNLRRDVHDFITAGADVTPEPDATGPVIVTSGSHLTFHAGNAINLYPGFVVEPGAVYTGIINDCIYGNNPRAASSVRNRERWGERAKAPPAKVVIFPNPVVDDYVSVIAPKDVELIEYQLYDDIGKLVMQSSFSSAGKMECDLTVVAPGHYILRVVASSGEVFNASLQRL